MTASRYRRPPADWDNTADGSIVRRSGDVLVGDTLSGILDDAVGSEHGMMVVRGLNGWEAYDPSDIVPTERVTVLEGDMRELVEWLCGLGFELPPDMMERYL